MKIFNDLFNKYKSLPVQIKASFWFLACAFMQKGIAALTTPIFTRLLSSHEYGEYTVYSSWQGIISCIVTLNLSGGMYVQALVKRNNKDKERFAAAMQGLSFVLVLVWFIIYLEFHKVWNSIIGLSTVQMVLMFISMWLTNVSSLWMVEQRIKYNYRRLVIVSVLASVFISLFSVVGIYLMDDKVTGRIAGGTIASLLLYFWLFVSQLIRGKSFFSVEDWTYALGYNIVLVPHYLSQMVLQSSDRIMIEQLVNPSSAGIYGLACSVAFIMTVFNSSLLQTIEPWIHTKIKENQVDRISSVAYTTFIFVALINLMLIIMTPEVIRLFAPPEYHEAIWTVPPMAMSVFFLFSYSFFALFEFYFEETRFISFATMIGAVLNIVLNYIFIPIFGYVAAGYTTLICYVTYAVMHYIFMRKVCNKYLNSIKVYNIKILLFISIVFMALGFLSMILYSFILIRYVIFGIAILIMIIRRRALLEWYKEMKATKL